MIDMVETLVRQIEEGAFLSWQKPWGCKPHYNTVSKQPYRGYNALWLQLVSKRYGYASHEWGTFKQWNTKGCKILKGSKATQIIYYTNILVEDSEGFTKSKPVLRTYSVFNRDQVSGAVECDSAFKAQPSDLAVSKLNSAIRRMCVGLKLGADSAFYRIPEDCIYMPHEQDFVAIEDVSQRDRFVAVLAHEAIHATAPRLKRTLPGNEKEYAIEELIAELGAAFVCGALGIDKLVSRKDHAAYLKNWLEALKEQPRYLLTLTAKAQAATDYLLGTLDQGSDTVDGELQ